MCKRKVGGVRASALEKKSSGFFLQRTAVLQSDAIASELRLQSFALEGEWGADFVLGVVY